MISLDIETSGLDPERTSILSIGALDTEEPTNQFYGECRIWDGADITDEALLINGFTREQATDSSKQSEAELNSSFDRDFSKAACMRAGITFPFAHRTIDTHSLVWLHMTEHNIIPATYVGSLGYEISAINLVAALEYCGLPPEEKPHNALNGAFAHAEVFSRIAYNKKILPQYFSYEIPWLSKK